MSSKVVEIYREAWREAGQIPSISHIYDIYIGVFSQEILESILSLYEDNGQYDDMDRVLVGGFCEVDLRAAEGYFLSEKDIANILDDESLVYISDDKIFNSAQLDI